MVIAKKSLSAHTGGQASRWVLALSATLAMSIGAGCASSRANGAQSTDLQGVRLAVLPEVWVTGETSSDLDAAALTRATIAKEEIFELVDPLLVGPQMQGMEDPAACFDDLSCVRQVGLALKADKLALMRLGQLGETVVVRLSMVDVAEAKLENTLQEVVSQDDPLDKAVQRVAERFVVLVKPAPPWYGRWWVLAGSSAIILGAAATTTWLLLRDTGPNMPRVITAP